MKRLCKPMCLCTAGAIIYALLMYGAITHAQPGKTQFFAEQVTEINGGGKPDKFQRGAKPTPADKIIDAIKGGSAKVFFAKAPPPQVITIPQRLSMWGNSQYGDCVTAESAFAIADYSTFLGMDEIFIPEATVIAWARSHGWLNGADLLSVIQDMQKDGIKDEKGVVRKAGTPSAVDFRNENTLQSAIAQGPVSIAIDADALPNGAGNKSGWYAFGGKSYRNTDHCVSLHGYGPAADLFKALNTPLPSNAPATVYYLYTWSTVGIVDHTWLMNTCTEAWVRNPTVTDLQPPPKPQPVDITVAMLNVSGQVGAAIKFAPTAKGGTSPYIFLFEYGDGAQDASGQHVYKTAGIYKATATVVDSTGKLGTGTCTATIGTDPTPPGPTPTPGGLRIIVQQDTPAGDYYLVRPGELDTIRRFLDGITGNGGKK